MPLRRSRRPSSAPVAPAAPRATPAHLRPLLLLGAAMLLLGGADACRIHPKRARFTPGPAEKVLNVNMADLQPAIASRIGKADRPAWVTPDRWSKVRAIYATFNNAPLWLEEGGAKDRAKALVEALRSAPEHALDTTAYPISAIERIASAKRLTDTASAASIADADVLLTSAYVAYAADMLSGQVDPTTVSQAWHIGTNKTELDSALVRSLQDSDMTLSLKEMQPQDPDYPVLVKAYAHFRKLAASGGWRPIPATAGPARDAAVRARLAASFVPDSGSGSAVGDTVGRVAAADSQPTRAAVKTTVAGGALGPEIALFQERHGLARTGTLDKQTIATMNVSAEERAKQIAANLERHRWLPRTLGTRYVYVNVPAFRLDAYDSGQKQLSMKVVVGKEYEGRVTPVFSDTMESVVFRPYWNITPDIQAKEVGPKVASDPGYLERENMEYYKDGGTTRIRQRPGGKNSLGLVKFLFPNSFNIYLHDTPAKELFNKTDRAASHGCIRLEKPAEMAQWVLGWDADRVSAAMNGEDNHAVRVPQKLPVFIVYFTAYMRDGHLYFADDVYGRDTPLEQKVAKAS